MPRYVMAVQAGKCLNCKACILACQQRNGVAYGFYRNWVRATPAEGSATGYAFQPGSCMQCDAPLCVAACPTRATFKDTDGVVRIDRRRCIGCGSCITACPYDARHRDPVLGVADKCDYCTATLRQGQEPACVQACATRVRIFGDAANPEDPVAKALAAGQVTLVEPATNSPKPTQVYLGRTSPTNWPRQAALTTPVALMGVAATGTRWLGALSLFGVLAVFIRQLFSSSDDHPPRGRAASTSTQGGS